MAASMVVNGGEVATSSNPKPAVEGVEAWVAAVVPRAADAR